MRRTIILALVVGAVAAFGQTAAGEASVSDDMEIGSGRSAAGCT